MKVMNTRIPLAIALTSVLAFAVGCDNTTTVDERADVQTAAERDAQNAPAGTAPGTTPIAQDGTTYGEAAQDRTMDERTLADAGDIGDGPDSDQPIDDTWITTKVKSSLLADTDVAGLDIEVETVNGVVTLTGEVDEQAQIDHATRIARDIEGVTDVQTSGLTVATDQ